MSQQNGTILSHVTAIRDELVPCRSSTARLSTVYVANGTVGSIVPGQRNSLLPYCDEMVNMLAVSSMKPFSFCV